MTLKKIPSIKGQNRWVFSGRLEHNQADILDAEANFTDLYTNIKTTQVNPSVSLGYVRQLKDGLDLGVWFGRAQRSGGLTEKFINYFPLGLDPYEMLGNPELNPEKNMQADLILEYRKKGSSVSINMFNAFLRDYISSEINPEISSPSSYGRFR